MQLLHLFLTYISSTFQVRLQRIKTFHLSVPRFAHSVAHIHVYASPPESTTRFTSSFGLAGAPPVRAAFGGLTVWFFDCAFLLYLVRAGCTQLHFDVVLVGPTFSVDARQLRGAPPRGTRARARGVSVRPDGPLLVARPPRLGRAGRRPLSGPLPPGQHGAASEGATALM